jgi:NADH-quinone oxidoreductase subunit J
VEKTASFGFGQPDCHCLGSLLERWGMMSELAFYFFAVLTFVGVILTIVSRHPVSSGMSLILAFFGLAGLYVWLQAPVVAVLQILVYAGAIMVLFVFVIMLLNVQKEDLGQSISIKQGILGAFFGLGLVSVVTTAFLQFPPAVWPDVKKPFGLVSDMANLLFFKYVVLFEVSGLLLLAAMVGVIVLNIRSQSGTPSSKEKR